MAFHADIILTLVLMNDTANGNVVVVGQLHQPQDEFLRLCDIIEVIQEVGHTINDYDGRTGCLNLVLDDNFTMLQAFSSQVVTPELLMVALEFPAQEVVNSMADNDGVVLGLLSVEVQHLGLFTRSSTDTQSFRTEDTGHQDGCCLCLTLLGLGLDGEQVT